MQISEQELREMIRDAVARHGGGGHARELPAGLPGGQATSHGTHASHGLFALVASVDGDCIIEPTVRCNHCGFCKSLGH